MHKVIDWKVDVQKIQAISQNLIESTKKRCDEIINEKNINIDIFNVIEF
jgi:hypothetical protein